MSAQQGNVLLQQRTDTQELRIYKTTDSAARLELIFKLDLYSLQSGRLERSFQKVEIHNLLYPLTFSVPLTPR